MHQLELRMALLALCAGPLGCGGQKEPGPVTWATTAAEHREAVGRQFTYACPSGGSVSQSWGTDLYTDDSSICTAAVHAGLVDVESGGTVTIEMRPGEGSYTGSRRNGVSTGHFGAWANAFSFKR